MTVADVALSAEARAMIEHHAEERCQQAPDAEADDGGDAARRHGDDENQEFEHAVPSIIAFAAGGPNIGYAAQSGGAG